MSWVTVKLRQAACESLASSASVHAFAIVTMSAPASVSPSWQTLHQMVRKAQQKLNLDAWDYILGGTETETTLKRNRMALDTVAFRPRVLRDVSHASARSMSMGTELRLPVCLAPVGSLELFAEGAAVPSALAAHAFGCLTMLSSVCQPGIEALAQAAPEAKRWFQLYVHGDPAWVDDMADRSQAAGYQGLMLTVDSAVYTRRERDIAKGNARRVSVPGREHQARLTWQDVDRLKRRLRIPIGLKGIMTAEDAQMALDHGVDVIYVSNHGGRQLDHGMGSLHALPEITAVVKGRVPVWIDGGFYRGTDIVKAKLLGADVIGLGRMQCWALAAGGQAGVERMLELLEAEVLQCMSLLGISDWSQADPALVQAAPLAAMPDVLSAFPLMDEASRDWYA